eukprot:CAMPEP_0204600574 /NCGR_PEP_ID=MMETSP0661-20131031/55516_1 /ASSEMBLY_ACC=CAM_ASM_000606 /TAXON_ID=109239 /ORGANISM="Alexandrium margalefi, Strain AMGDE01CS-322" /LENGTH=290 /DNA_ID=CAMNT_0051611385 /DNA_START=65 /DNA_END=937 /DNA_ORIENTATION=-
MKRPAAALGEVIPGVKACWTFPAAPNAVMVDIFAREKGLDISSLEHFVDLPSLENRSDECLGMNPQGSVPWFVLANGTVLAETIAMMEYIEEQIPEPALVGSSAAERAVVRMWQRRMEEHYCIPSFYGHRNWCHSEDCPPDHFMKDFFGKRLTPHHGATVMPEGWRGWTNWARNKLAWLDRVKQEEAKKDGGKTTDYIAGDTVSMVDIQVYVVLWFFGDAFPHPPQTYLEDLKGQVPWLQAWYDRMSARPAVVAAKEYREKSLAEHITAQSQTSKNADTVAAAKAAKTSE